MKTALLSSVVLMLISSSVLSQNCNLALKDGSKITAAITLFNNPLNADKKFLKAKEEQRDELVAAYNVEVLSGKIAPSNSITMNFTIHKKRVVDSDEYAFAYNAGGVDYFSYVVCRNDTLYSARNRGIVPVGTADNPIGFSLQGIQIIPMNLKVGDVLPPFEDFGFSLPTSADVTLYKKVLAGYEYVNSTRYGPGIDSRTGVYHENAAWDVSTPREVYKYIPIDARQTCTTSSYGIQGMNAIVTGKEEVTVSGVKYEAYIIESESWTKSNTSTSYESAEAELNVAAAKADQKLQTRMEKFRVRRQFTNELGFYVQSSQQWVVPALGGAVKSVSYDTWGGISTIITTTELE